MHNSAVSVQNSLPSNVLGQSTNEEMDVRCFVFQCLNNDCFRCAVPPRAGGTRWRSTFIIGSSAITAVLVTIALVVGRCSVRMTMCVNTIISVIPVIPLPDNLSTEEEQW